MKITNILLVDHLNLMILFNLETKVIKIVKIIY
jgi:hypothetical protein